MTTQLIHHSAGDIDILQRTHDGYIDASALCRAAGKAWEQYHAGPAAQEFIAELASDTRIPAAELIQSSEPGVAQATWVHPQIATHLAYGLSAIFAIKVATWIHDWMACRGLPSARSHLHRYLANDSNIPVDQFSILQETTLGLIGPLHMMGFDIHKGWWPDVFVDSHFCAYLRSTHGIDTDALLTYWHDYLDGRPRVNAKLYPIDVLPVYRLWFHQIWLPINGVALFAANDKSSLAFLDKLPALAAPTKPTAKPLPWHTACTEPAC
jgi:hypothetical protein